MTEKRNLPCGLDFFLESRGKSGQDFSMSDDMNSRLKLGCML